MKLFAILKTLFVGVSLFLLGPFAYGATSTLWGQSGELWSPTSRLPDFSRAGYHGGEISIPTVSVKTNVRDYGAVGDGVTDDSTAFLNALNATSNGAIYIPAGRYKITKQFNITKSNIVFRGEGRDVTTLYFPKTLETVVGPAATYAPGGSWSWSGGFFQVSGDNNGSKLATVTVAASKGSTTLTVSKTTGMSVGQRIRIITWNTDGSWATYLFGNQHSGPSELVGTKGADFPCKITAIQGTTLTIDRPLRTDLQLKWNPEVDSDIPVLHDIGFEDMTLEFPDVPYPGHHLEPGSNGFDLQTVENCWIRRIRFINCDSGIFIHESSWFNTVQSVQFSATSNRFVNGYDDVSIHPWPIAGHHGLVGLSYAVDNLYTDFHFDMRMIHELSVENQSTGNVFDNGDGLDMVSDHHRRAPYGNLYTNINMGIGDRIWEAGGDTVDGAECAAWETYWNIRANQAQKWPTNWDYAPVLMNWVGVTTSLATSTPATGNWVEAIAPASLTPPDLYLAQVAYHQGGTLPDTTPPSVPASLSAVAVSSAQINLSWSASTDVGGGVAGYQIFSNGTLLTTTTSTSYSHQGLAVSTAYTYFVKAYDTSNNISAASSSATATTFAPLPGITSAGTANAIVGSSFSYTITATNNPTSFSATGLPSGLSINTNTGEISGTPTVSGVSSVTLRATNASGTGTKTLALTVAQAPPNITSASTATATVGTAFSYTILATNSPTSYGATGLPSGLSINTNTGVLSGTPTAAGTSNITLSATNAGGTDTQALTLTVVSNPPAITSSGNASGTIGAAFSYTITATNSPTSFGATGLPGGLSINTNTGVISGTPGATGSSTITLSATNASGTGTKALTLTVGQNPPVITSTDTASGIVGTAFTYTIVATNSPTSYGATGLPSGLSINTNTGVLSGTPTAAGTSNITLSATNAGGTDTQALTLTVTSNLPVITSPDTAGGTVGVAFSYTITATNNPTSFNATGLPSGLSINTNSGVISGTPTAAGTSAITLTAANASGSSTQGQTLTITVTADTVPPTVPTGLTAIAVSSTQINLTWNASTDAEGAVAGYKIYSNGSLVISIAGTSYLHKGLVPSTAYTYTVAAYDTASNTSATSSSATATTLIPPPSITSSGNASGTIGAAFSYTITATNNPTSFSATGLPSGLSINTNTGEISGTPTVSGVSSVTLRATNASGTGTKTLTLTVGQNPPVITSTDTASGIVGTAFTYTIVAANSPTSYGATGLPSGLSINTNTGVISGTPTAAGTFNITLSATNAGGTDTQTLTLTIVSNPPAITSSGNASGTIGTAFRYTITATNSPTSFNATGLPSGLSINTNTGVISGTPGATGSSTITLSATNTSGTGTKTLTLTVGQNPPIITSTDTASGIVGTAFTYTIVATNSPTSYGATGLPSGLSINTNTGVLSGTPTAAGTFNITLSATNAGGTDTQVLDLTIVSNSPSITSSSNASGTVGTAFSYTIRATNSPTSFNATGLPSGLSINTNTGVISGTPTSDGTFTITLSATNAGGTGTKTLTLAIDAFVDTTPPSTPGNLSVVAVSPVQINISWSASTDPDSEVAGYRIYRNGASVGVSTTTTYSDSGLSPSTNYRYAVAAFDTTGNLSPRSSYRSVRTPTSPIPTTPSGLTATAISSTQINLTWNASTEQGGAITGYCVFRSGTQIASIPATSFSDTGLSPATLYAYQVSAYDAVGVGSSLSASVSTATLSGSSTSRVLPAPILHLPAYLSVNGSLSVGYPAGYGQISFQWALTPNHGASASSAASSPAETSAAPSASFRTPGNSANLAGYPLIPGSYDVTVQAFDADNNTSPVAQAVVTLVTSEMAGVRIYPNPWRSDQYANAPVTFDHLPLGCTVKLFTVSGHLVNTLTPSVDTVRWNLTNQSGDKVGSGLYLYLITNDQGQKLTGKLAIIK